MDFIGKNYMSMTGVVSSEGISRVTRRIQEGLKTVIVSNNHSGNIIFEIDQRGVVVGQHHTDSQRERGRLLGILQNKNGYNIKALQNTNGNNRSEEETLPGEYRMYTHVLERVRDRFPHTKAWSIPAVVRYTVKMFCSGTSEFLTTYGERYVIKGKMVFVVKY